MEQRVSLITLAVADLERSRRFYETGLGWAVVSGETEGIVCFQLGGLVLALYGREAFAEDAKLTGPAEAVRPSVALAHNTRSRAEVDAVMAEAVAAGAHPQKPAAETFWGGYAGYFADPDGHLWEIAWNPFSPLTEDGCFLWQA
ncbi:VOC family protein [Thalassobaculum sp. OXR-137]|uniref:VOC family protein n=1 Tax=Thalassobaculum sp. OXR-137 TaxID=3100173 RepID=UPI002AC9E55D|nr:VOC family protein [Thalassobaculum sp. OXR-137]WPZ34835.1 VOC family protein [Thalassobaculum sp. OXR-137]